MIACRVVEIAPQVSGRITRVNIEPMQHQDKGDILFEIDSTVYEARVEDLKARLELAALRLVQFKELTAEDSGFFQD